MKRRLFFFFFFLTSTSFYAQDLVLNGSIKDAVTQEALSGVSIVVKSGAVVSDKEGKYTLSLKGKDSLLTFRLIGYETQKFRRDQLQGTTLDILLKESTAHLKTIVVSAGRFEQRVEEVTVSMEVIQPDLVRSTNAVSMENIIDQVPGVNMVDGQANIRGGSGFSYGAGSRVLLLVDDVPMLSADAGDIKWDFLPIENLNQIEVIKGASSALYGSSALNGVINVRTAFPKDEPETRVSVFNGMYDKPQREELAWWGNMSPIYAGTNFSHGRKMGQVDFVLGGNAFMDNGYRQGERDQRFRLNNNLRYRFKKVEGLDAGVNTNIMYNQGGLFFLWQNDSVGAYKAYGAVNDSEAIAMNDQITRRLSIDPFMNYYHGKGNRHRLRTRYFKTDNVNDGGAQSFSELFYGEYQYQKRWDSLGLVVTGGAVTTIGRVKSVLYNDHEGSNNAVYLQADEKIKRLSISLGVRWENFTLDTFSGHSSPVIRSGLNYRLGKATYLRSSFGQGYRFPTVAEKFVRTSVQNLNIYPNPDVRPEEGWSAEFAVKQGVKVSKWKGFVDAAAFWMEYTDMMQFTFGQWGTFNDPFFGIGFRSENVDSTRIRGMEFTIVGEGRIKNVPLRMMAGYTYMDPINLNISPDSSQDVRTLNYRFRHLARADIEAEIKKFKIGATLLYNSFMVNVDPIFEDPTVLPGVKSYREENNKGDYVINSRLGYRFNKNMQAALIVKNLLNREYMGRPADMRPPRSFVLQLDLRF